jgi:hypothetical protein
MARTRSEHAAVDDALGDAWNANAAGQEGRAADKRARALDHDRMFMRWNAGANIEAPLMSNPVRPTNGVEGDAWLRRMVDNSDDPDVVLTDYRTMRAEQLASRAGLALMEAKRREGSVCPEPTDVMGVPIDPRRPYRRATAADGYVPGETHGTVEPPVLPLYPDAGEVFAGRPRRRTIGEMYGGRYAYDPEVFDDHDRLRACEENERAGWMNEAGEEMPVGAAAQPFEEDMAEGEYGDAGRYDESGELRRDYAEGMGAEEAKGGEVAAAAAPLEPDGGGDGDGARRSTRVRLQNVPLNTPV